MFGFQSYSSFNIDKHTVPDGYILGCGRTGLNIHLGGLTGKSLAKSILKEYCPPYQGESFGPGIIQFHFKILVDPSGLSAGLATKPKG
jgi:hypothetical protein